MGGFGTADKIKARISSEEFLSVLPLPIKQDTDTLSDLKQSIIHSMRTGESLVLVSAICPPYSSDSSGRPNYRELGSGIEHNTSQHLTLLPRAIEKVASQGIGVIHFFLMADTEVDLLPFLAKLNIEPEEFIKRCQTSVDLISCRVEELYGSTCYFEERLPAAARFLVYFGKDRWYERYEYFRNRLISEMVQYPEGRIARGLKHDLGERDVLIRRLLGNINVDQQIEHLVRQRAQYMAFSFLLRDRFGRRLVIINHRTPNLKWMNDRITREPLDPEQLKHGNYLPNIPLVELDISTLPE